MFAVHGEGDGHPAGRGDDLKRALAAHAGLPEGCALTLGNGSDELITMLSMACDLPGAAVVGGTVVGMVVGSAVKWSMVTSRVTLWKLS
mgnify:CR=1 FL=1